MGSTLRRERLRLTVRIRVEDLWSVDNLESAGGQIWWMLCESRSFPRLFLLDVVIRSGILADLYSFIDIGVASDLSPTLRLYHSLYLGSSRTLLSSTSLFVASRLSSFLSFVDSSSRSDLRPGHRSAYDLHPHFLPSPQRRRRTPPNPIRFRHQSTDPSRAKCSGSWDSRGFEGRTRTGPWEGVWGGREGNEEESHGPREENQKEEGGGMEGRGRSVWQVGEERLS